MTAANKVKSKSDKPPATLAGGFVASVEKSDAGATAAIPLSVETTIPIDGVPYVSDNGTSISKLVIKPILFAKFSAAHMRAMLRTRGKNAADKYVLYWREELMRDQLVAFDRDGNPVKLSDLDIMTMPRSYASKVLQSVGMISTANRGEVLNDGNGIDTPVHYKLARSFKVINPTTKTTIEIKELEFSAATMNDIAPVLAAPHDYAQVIALVAQCAKPVMTESSLERLTDGLVAQLSTEDGIDILEKVLPGFLE